jgi:hypothetical protein
MLFRVVTVCDRAHALSHSVSMVTRKAGFRVLGVVVVFMSAIRRAARTADDAESMFHEKPPDYPSGSPVTATG